VFEIKPAYHRACSGHVRKAAVYPERQNPTNALPC
jgi:hypothetical protein